MDKGQAGTRAGLDALGEKNGSLTLLGFEPWLPRQTAQYCGEYPSYC